jgi:hypothetical protein
MKFTNGFVNKASDWLLNQTSQSNTQITNLFVNFIMNFWTLQRICEVRNEVRNILVKSKLKSTVKNLLNFIGSLSQVGALLKWGPAGIPPPLGGSVHRETGIFEIEGPLQSLHMQSS